ncbi:MAG: heterodisulfide reductase-related iron-sulfur binding cluster [Candidatus Korobacteraceae bacterium]
MPLVPLTALEKSARTGVYDSHHPPATELIDQCVHCGFCLPVCPTYLLWNQEMDSPRGRIYLMKTGSEGAASMDQTFVSHFDRCLGCMACMTACPSGVQYGKLIEATRAQIERNYRRPFLDRLFRRLIFAVFPHRRRLRWLLLPLWFYQRSGLRWLLRKTGLLRLLPERLRSMESLLPELHLRALFAPALHGVVPGGVPLRTPRLRVGVLLGCVQSVLFANVNAATVRVLAALGCEVVVPNDQQCCGALMAHAGREPEALDAARRLIEVFERAAVDVVAVNAAGCGSNLKEYAYLWRDDPEFAQRAQAFAAKCRDITELVAELGFPSSSNPVRLKVAYQDACHLQHAQGIRTQPRQLLSAIPGLEWTELPESATCCGSAGIFNLIEPETARRLADRKAQLVLRSGAQALVSANPGCLLHIASGLRRAGHPLPVLHIVELIDAALGSSSLELR